MIKNHYKIILILCCITSLARFVLDSYLPSLPAIGHYFSMPARDVQLTLTFYLLGFSISQLFYGPLSDRFGRRKIIVFGISIFLLGNLICSLSVSPVMLLIFRLVAGAGAGACGVINRAIASDCFKGADFSRAWSYTTTTLVLTLIVAPVLGGYVQYGFGWRANFFLAAGVTAVVLWIILKYLPETNTRTNTFKLDFRKIFNDYLFILRSRKFVFCTLCYTLAFAGLIAYFQVSPLIYINIFGLTPVEYGWTSLVIALSYLAGGVVVSRLAHHMGIHKLLILGTLVLITGGTLMMLTAYLFADMKLWSILLPAAVYVVGARIVIPNAIAGSMEEFRHLGGSTSALIGCIQMLGSSIVSILIAHCSYHTVLPLSSALTGLGLVTMCVAFFIFPRKTAIR